MLTGEGREERDGWNESWNDTRGGGELMKKIQRKEWIDGMDGGREGGRREEGRRDYSKIMQHMH